MSEAGVQSRRGVSPISLAAVVVTGLIPIAGVLLWGWNAIPIVLLYWVETIVAGFIAWLRVRSVEDGEARGRPQRDSSEFLVIHYGVFTLVHGVFVFILAIGFMSPDGLPGFWRTSFGSVDFWIAVASVIALSLLAWWRDWVKPQAWRGGDTGVEMFRPYGRIFAMHLMVVLGFWAITLNNGSANLVVLLCGAKLVIDVIIEFAHARKPLKFAPGDGD